MADTFLKISAAWEIGMKHGVGPVIAGPDSFYLIAHNTIFLDSPGGGLLIFGALGAVAGKLLDKKLPEEYVPVAYNDLPAGVISHPEWPVKPRDTSKSKAIVIPYNKVQSAKMTWWGGLTVESNGIKFKLKGWFWNRKTVGEFLSRRGLCN